MKGKIIYSVLAVLMLLLPISCSSNKSDSLTGMWKIRTYADPFKATLGQTVVSADELYTLQLLDDGNFSFATDCNTISGEYSTNENYLRFTNTCATEMACDKEIVERSIKSNLPMIESYDMPTDSTLKLIGSHGNVLIELVKVSNQK